MKKFISVALAILMMLSVVPMALFTVSAAGTNTVTIKDAEGNTPDAAKDKTTINAAFDWVYAQNNSGDYTIYLNGDVSTADYMNPETYDSKNVKTVRIDGQGYTLTSTNGTAVFYGIGLYNLKLTDLNIVSSANNSLDWSPRKTTSDNYANYISTGSNPVMDTLAEFTRVTLVPAAGKTAGNFKLKGGNSGAKNTGTYGIVLTDCHFTCNVVDTMFMMNDKGCLDLKIVGTTLNYIGGASNNTGNNHMFQLGGSDVSVEVVNSENNVSRLIADTTGYRDYTGIFCPNNNDKFNFTFGKDVELILRGVSAGATFIYTSDKGTQTVVDNGAKWIAEGAGYVYLPTNVNGGDNWFVDGNLVAGNYYHVGKGERVEFTHGAIPAGTPAVPEYPMYIGTTGYSDFGAALKAVKEGETIEINRDIYVKSEVAAENKSFTIDAKGNTIRGAWSAYFFDGRYSGVITFKNADIYTYKGFWFDNNGFIFENCNIHTSFGLALRNSPAAGKSVSVTLINTTWVHDNTATRAAEPFCLGGNNSDSDFTVSLVNSTISSNTGLKFYEGNGNNSIFNLYTKGNVTVNLDGKSTIEAAGPYTAGIFNQQAENKSLNINLAKGATVKATGTSGVKFVSKANGACINTTVTDNGAKWVVGEDASIVLPTTVNGAQAAWYKGDLNVATSYYNSGAEAVLVNKVATTDEEKYDVYLVVDGRTSYYNTIDEAVEALGAIYNVSTDGLTAEELYEAVGSPVIYAKSRYEAGASDRVIDASWRHTNYDPNCHKTIVIDLEQADGSRGGLAFGAQANSYNGRIAICGLAWVDFTMMNADLYMPAPAGDNSILWNGNENGSLTPGESFTTFENCTIDQDFANAKANSGSGSLFKMNGKAKANADTNGDGKNDDTVLTDIYNLDLIDCEINFATAVGLQVHWGADANVSLYNTVWTADGIVTNGYNNDCILKAYEAGECTFYLDGTSKLIGNVQDGATTVTLIRIMSNTGAKNTVILEEGAELVMNNESSKLVGAVFTELAGKYGDELIDNGAIYTVSEADADVVVAPKFAETVVGYMTEEGELYQTLGQAGSFVAIKYAADEFAMVDGAALRTVWKENGIRFTTTMSEDLYLALVDIATFGTVIAPDAEGANPGAYAGEKLDIEAASIYADDKGNFVYQAAVIMPYEEYDAKTVYTTKLAANSYFTVTYADGTTATFTADFGAENVRSMYDVAVALNAQGISNRVIDRILSVCAA